MLQLLHDRHVDLAPLEPQSWQSGEFLLFLKIISFSPPLLPSPRSLLVSLVHFKREKERERERKRERERERREETSPHPPLPLGCAILFARFFSFFTVTYSMCGGDDGRATYVGVPALVGNRARAGQGQSRGEERGQTRVLPRPPFPRPSASVLVPSRSHTRCLTAFPPVP